MGLALRDDAYHTHGEYLTWPEGVRYPLIDGEAFLLAPVPTVRHQEVAGAVYCQLRAALKGKPCQALIATVDVLVVRDPAKVGERSVRGAPDFVLDGMSIQRDALAERLPQPEY